jgi:glycogen synthase
MKKNIVHYTNEAIPFNKLGGLADFIKGMTEAQVKNNNVHVFLTSCDERYFNDFEEKEVLSFSIGVFEFDITLLHKKLNNINYYFIKLPFESNKIQVYSSVIDDKYLNLYIKAYIVKEKIKNSSWLNL